VLKNAGILTKTNHPKTRMGYKTTHLSEYWGFLHSEPIHETLDEELPQDVLRAVAFYRFVVTHSPSFFLFPSNKTGHLDPYLELILGSHMLKTDWKDFDFLYFVGTMGLIVDYSHSDEKYREEIVSFLVENKNDIYGHTSLKNPERLFHNMIQAHGMIRDRHNIRPDSESTQSSFCFDSNIFKKLLRFLEKKAL